MAKNNLSKFDEELDAAIVTPFLYGIESELLPEGEVDHKLNAFRNTKGYKEAMKYAKSAIDTHIIGEDEYPRKNDGSVTILLTTDILRREQRKALYGKKEK